MEFLIEYGYIGVFIASFLAATVLPFSSEVVLTGVLLAGAAYWPCMIAATLGNFLGGMTSYWVGNALIRNGYRPSPVKEGQLNITCKSPHELVVAFPEGCKEELRTVAELVSLIGMRKSFYGHGNNVSRL